MFQGIFLFPQWTLKQKQKFKDPFNITERWVPSYTAAFYLLEPREGEREYENNETQKWWFYLEGEKYEN